MTAHRGKGEGSIYKRGDGRWMAQVELARTPDGKRRYARAVRDTRGEAQQALKDLTRKADKGVAPGRADSVEAYLGFWLDDVLTNENVTRSTVARYRRAVDDWLLPYIGGIRLDQLGPADVTRLLGQLTRRGLAPMSVRMARSTLHRALRYATRTGLVERNVAGLVDGPRGGHPIRDALTLDEQRAVLEAAAGDRFEALAHLVLKLGLRRGEALALRWEDIDLTEGAEGLNITAAKTGAGVRHLPLVNGTADALRRAHVAAGSPATGPVFATGRGAPLHPRKALDWWHALTARSIGRRCRLHAARHTCATLLLADGVPLEVVSKILGHSGIAITADIYAQVGQDAQREALRRLG